MALCLDKMTRRHPHVFGEATAATPEEVVHQWEEIKKTEKGNEERKFIVDGCLSTSRPPKGAKAAEEGSQGGF